MGKLNLEDYYLQTKEVGGPIKPKDGEKSFDDELKEFLKLIDKKISSKYGWDRRLGVGKKVNFIFI